MDLAALPVLSLSDAAGQLSRDIGVSFRRFGFALVRDHGIDGALIAQGWQLTEQFFARDTTEKLDYCGTEQGGARGYTPFGRETAKGAGVADLRG
jgi:isopenicillin N synthase-like dioxygenase